MNSINKVGMVLIKSEKETFSQMEVEKTMEWLGDYSIHMVRTIEMLKKYKDISDEDFLTNEAFKRYKGVAMSISFPIKNYNALVNNTEVIESSENLEALEQGLLIQSWSSLGSLLESSLQMFLAFYYNDFLKSNWSMWDKKAIEDIQSVIEKLNGKLIDKVDNNSKSVDGGLNGKIRKSFLKEVKGILRRKSRMPNLDSLTLSELIDFYFSNEVINNNSYSWISSLS